MAGKKVEILNHFTDNVTKMESSLNAVKISNICDFKVSINLADMYLKNTLGGSKKKIVLFVCSPFECEIDTVLNIGKKLRENKICLEVISFGNIEKNHEILKLLVDSVLYNSYLTEIFLEEDFNNKITNTINEYRFPNFCPKGIFIEKPLKYEKEIINNFSALKINDNIDIDLDM